MVETFLLIIFYLFFAYLSWKKTKWAISLIIIGLPSYLIRFKLGLVPLTFLEIMIVVLFGVWLIKTLFQKKKIDFSSLRWPALLFLLTAILAVLISPDLKSALGIFKAYFLEALLFFLVLINNIKTLRDFKQIIWSLGISALFVSLIGIWQYLDLWPGLEPWISQTPKRVSSVFEYPNAVGLYLGPILGLVLGIILTYRKLSKNISIFLGGVILFSLLALIFSVSRGALLGVLATLIFISFFSQYKKWIWVAFLILMVLILIIPQIRAQISSIISTKDVSTDVRIVMWQGTWQLLKEHPIEGAGLAGFSILYDKYRLIKHTELLLYPHNIFLNFWVELGLVGLLIFLWVIWEFFKTGVRLTKEKIENKPLVIGLLAAMIVIIIHGLVDVPYFKNDLAVLFWIIIGLMITLKTLYQSGQSSQNTL